MLGGAPSGALISMIDLSSSLGCAIPSPTSGTKNGGVRSEVSLSLSDCSIKFRSRLDYVHEGFDNLFGLEMIFSKATAFFVVSTTSMVLRFTQPHFIKRRLMINRGVI